MSHYVCKGDCKTVSENPGVCETDDCRMKGEGFSECQCVDGSHTQSPAADSSGGENER